MTGPMAFAHAIVIEAYRDMNARLVEVTSCNEPPHSRGSRHWSGNALDYDLIDSGVGSVQWERLHKRIAEDLGNDYDVVLELTSPHIHVEHDPEMP
jgi:hypothetical protein